MRGHHKRPNKSRVMLLTPPLIAVDALHDVVKSGLARYIGMSSCYAYQFHAMQSYAKSRNVSGYISQRGGSLLS